MVRSASIFVLISCLAGCAPRLIPVHDGWQLESSPYRILSTERGTIMPDGWVLTNYSDDFRKTDAGDPADLRLGTKNDAAFLWVERVRREDLGPNLVVSLNGFVDRLKSIEESREFTNVLGVPLGQAEVRIPYDVVKVTDASLELPHANAAEAVIERSRLGARAVEEMWYVAYLAPKTSNQPVIRIIYENEPSRFAAHLEDVRALTRRVRFNP